MQKDEYSVDYDIKDRRKLMTPVENYLDITKVERIIYDGTANVEQSFLDMFKNNLRKIMNLHFTVKKGLVHIANVSKFLQWNVVDLLRAEKPYQNKLLK